MNINNQITKGKKMSFSIDEKGEKEFATKKFQHCHLIYNCLIQICFVGPKNIINPFLLKSSLYVSFMLFDTYLTHKALIKFFATCPSAIEKKASFSRNCTYPNQQKIIVFKFNLVTFCIRIWHTFIIIRFKTIQRFYNHI